jgi:hypothetical protein
MYSAVTWAGADPVLCSNMRIHASGPALHVYAAAPASILRARSRTDWIRCHHPLPHFRSEGHYGARLARSVSASYLHACMCLQGMLLLEV